MSLLRRIIRGLALITALVFIFLISFYVSGNRDSGIQRAFIHTFGDVMEWKSQWVGGRGAVNCGTVPVRGDPKEATDCAMREFAAHHAFRVRYGLQTMDTVMAAGVVAAPNGHVYELIFSGGSPTGTTDVFRQRAVINGCPVPAALRRTPNGRVTCFSPGPSTPTNWTSSWLSAP
jgi:hypothetical protein